MLTTVSWTTRLVHNECVRVRMSGCVQLCTNMLKSIMQLKMQKPLNLERSAPHKHTRTVKPFIAICATQ